MKKIYLINLFLVFFIITTQFKIVCAQEIAPASQSIKISKETREIRVEGTFNITKGILEFIAASNKTPRDYESLFLLDAKPSQIQSALIEIGMNPCLEKKEFCNNLDISVSWNTGKVQVTRNIIDFIITNQTDTAIKDLQWLFTGREINKDAKDKSIPEDKNGEIIALQPGIAGIIHPNIDFGNPYDENKQKGFRINEKLFNELISSEQIPKDDKIKQTKLTLIFKPINSKK
jgi:hypothetical protein